MLSRFTVSSPATAAITISLSFGARERSTINKSLSNIPACCMESPFALTKNVSDGWAIRYSFKSNSASRWSSAGDAKPAATLELNKGILSGVLNRE